MASDLIYKKKKVKNSTYKKPVKNVLIRHGLLINIQQVDYRVHRLFFLFFLFALFSGIYRATIIKNTVQTALQLPQHGHGGKTLKM